ncbi:MAG: efflux RND transporter periplasmic adaptor subunit [Deltaproteobacteria bacterium]|nr:efflux RND transporter periplasmic adaptor subunit [Deltaproteobacteria bacterium]
MKKVLTVLIALVVIAAAYLALREGNKKPVYVETLGVIEATEVEISSKTNGRIAWLCCREGDMVRANSPMIRLDDSEAKARVKEAAAGVERVAALLDDAKKDFLRVSSLYKEGVVTERELDSAKARQSSLFAELESARARLKIFEVGLKDTGVLSPVDGTVVYRAYETGEMVSPGVAVYTVHDVENIWARVDVEETVLGGIKLGGRAVVTARALAGMEFEGEVVEIGRVGEFATQRDVTRGRPDIRTFRIKVAINRRGRLVGGHDGSLKAGMTVNVRFLPFNGQNKG